MYATYKSVFTNVFVYPTTGNLTGKQNLLFVMSDQKIDSNLYAEALGVRPMTVTPGVVMTDDFAPVEQLIAH